ncbi:MAG: PH domain-containing protein [Desulfomonile tiedjei]|nr:PH domain-containing protein [Desulfomonile tiedjei]
MEEKMQANLYRVDPRVIPPVVLAIGFGAFLLFLEGLSERGILLAVLLSPFFYLGAEILARRISLDSKGITVSKFLRTVRFEWSQVESLDAVQAGRKLFMILQTENGRPVIFTNTIQPFTDLVEKMMTFIPKEKISGAAAELLVNPPSKHGPLIQAWIVCLVFTALVVGKLLGYA